MVQRSDYKVQYASSPRQVTIDDPSTEFVAQDVIDTLAAEQALIDALDDDQLMAAAGKEDLGSGQSVGLTVTLQNTQIGFEMPPTATESGTATTTDTTGRYLDDSTALFVTNAVKAGDAIINFTTQAWGTVSRIISETRIETTEQRMVGGTGNGFTSTDVYKVIPVKQCDISGGNVVAIDSNDVAISSTFPTAFTQINRTSSSSAVQGDIEEIRLGSYDDKVSVKSGSGNSGTIYPTGNKANPVDNIPDAVTIANQSDKGFDRIKITGNFTFDTGDDVTDFVVEGQSAAKSLFTVNAGSTVLRTIWEHATVTGSFDNDTEFNECHLTGSMQFVRANIHNSVLEPSMNMVLAGSDPTLLINCVSGMDAGTAPTIDMGGSGRNLGVRSFSGMLKITNLTGANVADIHMSEGKIIIDSTCTDGTITVYGDAEIEDNSTGSTVVDERYSTIELLQRVLGLSQENQYIDNTAYDSDNNLVSGRIRTYEDAASVGTSSNVTATYTVTATYSGGDLQTYKVVKA